MESLQQLCSGVPDYSVFISGPRIPALDFILPNKTVRHEEFQKSCELLKIDSFYTYKYLYIMLDSDLDVFEAIITQRVEILILLWSKFYESPWPRNLQAELCVGRSLLHHTLQVWFSCEWPLCALNLRKRLLNEFRKNLCLLPLAEGIDFDTALGLGITPWNVSYLYEIMEQYMNLEINDVIPKATSADISFLIEEGLPLILNRLMKLFDCCKMQACRNLCLRTLAAWNSQVYQKSRHLMSITAKSEAHCLLHISHIYLLVIYEADDRKGRKIDKIINEIRFFINGFQQVRPTVTECIKELSTYTASNYIALTIYQLNMTNKDFFVEFAMDNAAEETPTFYAVLLQSYLSYLLANWLLDYSMNHWELQPDMPYFIKVFSAYVETRQRSEQFLLAEERKQQRQKKSHNLGKIVKYTTNFKEQINKGNLCENLIRHDFQAISDEVIFEHLPPHEQLHLHIYNLLINSQHNGWYTANIVLLLKIISQRLNEIEIYRYQPGLTTDFMLGLDIKLAKYFENLSVIFDNSYLFAQECWLTAFYLHPTVENYRQVQRCGLRLLRSAKCEKSAKYLNSARIKHLEQLSLLKNSKYQLLSSTIDVYEIVKHTNNVEMNADYAQLQQTIFKLDIPEACIKDLLTVCFAARSRYFAWAVPWSQLQKRCKIFLNNAQQKRRFVEQSMAEANERLKFLHIDYEKYKHRPMIDYGCIESGYEQDYENVETNFLPDKESDAEFSETSDEDYEHETALHKRAKSEQLQERERKDKLLLELDDSCFQGGRRTRARAASALRNQQVQQLDMKPSCSTAAPAAALPTVEPSDPIIVVCSLKPMFDDQSQDKRDLYEFLTNRLSFKNSTEGFIAIRDIWNYTENDVAGVDFSTIELPEVNSSLEYFIGFADLVAKVDESLEKSRKSNAQNAKETAGEQTDDTLSEGECFSTEVSPNIKSSIQSVEAKPAESRANVSTEIDLQEESDAMEVNLQIFFNKNKGSDDPFDSLEITNSPDASFYADIDVQEVNVLESEIIPNAAEDDFTAPIELFEDVPNSSEHNEVDEKVNYEPFNPLIDHCKKMIHNVQESGYNAYRLKEKLRSIMQNLGMEDDLSNDEDDDEDDDDDDEYDNEDDVAFIDFSDDDLEENSDNDNVEEQQQQLENGKDTQMEQTKKTPQRVHDVNSFAYLKPIVSTFKENLREMFHIKQEDLDDFIDINQNATENKNKPDDTKTIEERDVDQAPISNVQTSISTTKFILKESNEAIVETVQMPPTCPSSTETMQMTPTCPSPTEIETGQMTPTCPSPTEIETVQMTPTCPSPTEIETSAYFAEVLANDASVETEPMISICPSPSPSSTDSDTEFLNKLSQSNELNAVVPLDEHSDTCNKRMSSPNLDIEIVPLKRSRDSEIETESTQVVEKDPIASPHCENLPRQNIDCTLPQWQPRVRLQRLQVVQGHVIRDVRVCVRRLNNNIPYTRKKAVRFAPSSMVYEYIEDDEGVSQHSELLKDCPSSNKSNIPVIHFVEDDSDDVDGDDDDDDDDEYEDADDTEYSPSKDIIQPAMSKRRSRRKNHNNKKRLSKRPNSPFHPYSIVENIILDSDEENIILDDEEQPTEYIEIPSFEEEIVLGN